MGQRKISNKKLEKAFKDLRIPKDLGIKHHVWEDENGKYSSWKIGNMYTNDAGMKLFNEALKEELTRYGTE